MNLFCVYHINRLMKADIRTHNGSVTTYDQLQHLTAFHGEAALELLADATTTASLQTLYIMNYILFTPIHTTFLVHITFGAMTTYHKIVNLNLQ